MYFIKNVRLYTGRGEYENGAVITDGGKILYAGDAENAPRCVGEVTIDGGGGICMPGLCDAHCHAPMVLLRGEGADLPLFDWLACVQKMEENFTPETIYTGTMLAIAELLRCGVTSFADMYFECADMIRAVIDSGIRANITRGSTSVEGVYSHIGLHREYDGEEGRVRVFVGLHGEYTSDKNVARAAVETAGKLGVGIHVHMSESLGEVAGCIKRHGVTPPAYFEQVGLFDVPVIAAHCVHVTDEDIDILARRGVYAAHNPASNMYLASGISPVAKMRERGVNVAIGTDGAASNNTLDMFREMRLAALLSKVSTMNASSIAAADVIKMATETGARAMGFDECGVLEEGRPADLCILDGDALHLHGADMASDIVYAACGSDVKLTMVNGRVLYYGGVYTKIDIEKLRADGRAAWASLRK